MTKQEALPISHMVPTPVLPRWTCDMSEVCCEHVNVAQQIKSFLDGHKGGNSFNESCLHVLKYLIKYLINTPDITEAEKTCFEEIQGKLHDLGGTEFVFKLPMDLQEFLRNKCQTWRDNKYTDLLASTCVVVQDARLTLECVTDEVGF
jgi:hypothetical protein